MAEIITFDMKADIKKLKKHAPKEFLNLQKTMYFYYGTKFHKRLWKKNPPIPIKPTDQDLTKSMCLIKVLEYYRSFSHKLTIVVYADAPITLSPPIIIIHGTHLTYK